MAWLIGQKGILLFKSFLTKFSQQLQKKLCTLRNALLCQLLFRKPIFNLCEFDPFAVISLQSIRAAIREQVSWSAAGAGGWYFGRAGHLGMTDMGAKIDHLRLTYGDNCKR